jgi:hypothetical protein
MEYDNNYFIIASQAYSLQYRRGYKPYMCRAYAKVMLASLACTDMASKTR